MPSRGVHRLVRHTVGWCGPTCAFARVAAIERRPVLHTRYTFTTSALVILVALIATIPRGTMRRVVLALAAGCSRTRLREPVTYRFQGQVTSSSGIFSGRDPWKSTGPSRSTRSLPTLTCLFRHPTRIGGCLLQLLASEWAANILVRCDTRLWFDPLELGISAAPDRRGRCPWFLNNFRCRHNLHGGFDVYHLQLRKAANSDRDFYLNFVARETVPGRVRPRSPKVCSTTRRTGASGSGFSESRQLFLHQ